MYNILYIKSFFDMFVLKYSAIQDMVIVQNNVEG